MTRSLLARRCIPDTGHISPEGFGSRVVFFPCAVDHLVRQQLFEPLSEMTCPLQAAPSRIC